MANILIVEDDTFKSEALTEVIIASGITLDIKYASDVATAISLVNEEEFFLIIVDMALPSHPVIQGGGSPVSLLTGGLEILFELSALSRSDPCLIITQYPEIEIVGRYYSIAEASKAIKDNFEIDVLGCLEYSQGADSWKILLKNVLKRI